MSEKIFLTFGLGAATSVLLAISWWRFQKLFKSSNNYLKKQRLPSSTSVKWLDSSSFEVLAAVCDAFIPSLSDSEITSEALVKAMSEIHPKFYNSGLAFSTDMLHQNLEYLSRGMMDLNIHIMSAEVIEKYVSNDDKFQLYLILKIMSTTVGSLLVLAKPVPFQVAIYAYNFVYYVLLLLIYFVKSLSLSHRINALCSLRDSSIPPMRVLYQARK